MSLSAQSLVFSSRFTAVLEASYALMPSLLVGEVWMQSHSDRPEGESSPTIESSTTSAAASPFTDLVAFYTPSPLLVSFPLDPASTTGEKGLPVAATPERPIDLAVARQYSTQHALSLNLAAEAAASGKPTWAKELSGDELLTHLTFKVEEVLAIPVLMKRTKKDPKESECVAVLIFYSSQNDDRIRLVESLKGLVSLLERVIELQDMAESKVSTPTIAPIGTATKTAAAYGLSYCTSPSEVSHCFSWNCHCSSPSTEPWLVSTLGLVKLAASALSASYVEVSALVEADKSVAAAGGIVDRTEKLARFYQTPSAPPPPPTPHVGLTVSSEMTRKPGTQPYPRTLAASRSIASLMTDVFAFGNEVSWLTASDLAARSLPEWHTAAIVRLRPTIHTADSSLPPSSSSSASTPQRPSSMGPVSKQVVAVFLWSDDTEPGLFCLSPHATSLLSAIARVAKQSAESAPPSIARGTLLYPSSPSHKPSATLLSPSSKRKGESGIDLLALVGESHSTPSRAAKRSFAESSAAVPAVSIPHESGTPAKRMTHDPTASSSSSSSSSSAAAIASSTISATQPGSTQATQQELLMHLLSDQLFSAPSSTAQGDASGGTGQGGVSASGGSTFTLANQNADAAASAAADAMALQAATAHLTVGANPLNPYLLIAPQDPHQGQAGGNYSEFDAEALFRNNYGNSPRHSLPPQGGLVNGMMMAGGMPGQIGSPIHNLSPPHHMPSYQHIHPSMQQVNGMSPNGVGSAGRLATRYSLHPSEHMQMTASGLPAVSAMALSRVKGRSRAPQPKISVALRRGKWSFEEEEFTHIIINTFKEGILPIADGTTLRTYVSGQLHCAPMRITKKYSKDDAIGKQCYKSNLHMPRDEWIRKSLEAKDLIYQARSKFHRAILMRNHIDLSMVAPDPFPEDGVVTSIFDEEGFVDDEYEEGGDDNSSTSLTQHGNMTVSEQVAALNQVQAGSSSSAPSSAARYPMASHSSSSSDSAEAAAAQAQQAYHAHVVQQQQHQQNQAMFEQQQQQHFLYQQQQQQQQAAAGGGGGGGGTGAGGGGGPIFSFPQLGHLNQQQQQQQQLQNQQAANAHQQQQLAIYLLQQDIQMRQQALHQNASLSFQQQQQQQQQQQYSIAMQNQLSAHASHRNQQTGFAAAQQEGDHALQMQSPNRSSHPVSSTPSRPVNNAADQRLSLQIPPNPQEIPRFSALPFNSPQDGGFGSSSISRNGSHLGDASASRTSLPGMLASTDPFVQFPDTSLGGLVNSPMASASHHNVDAQTGSIGLSLNSPATGPVVNPPPPPRLSTMSSNQGDDTEDTV